MSARILVAGGSGGIGAELCAAVAVRGYRPIVSYRRSRERAVQIAVASGGDALALDLIDPTSIERAIDEIAAGGSDLAGIVFAATAPLRLEPLSRVSADDFDTQWRIHVQGPRQLLAGLIPRCLRRQRRGTIVGVLSQAMGSETQPAMAMLAPYVVAKHALAGLLAATAADYPWLSVRTVAPGFTRTALLDAFDPRFLAQIEDRHPVSAPEDVAREIAACLPGLEVPRSLGVPAQEQPA